MKQHVKFPTSNSISPGEKKTKISVNSSINKPTSHSKYRRSIFGKTLLERSSTMPYRNFIMDIQFGKRKGAHILYPPHGQEIAGVRYYLEFELELNMD